MSKPDLSDHRIIHQTLRTAAHQMAGALADFEGGATAQAKALVKYRRGYAGGVLA